MNKSDRPSMYRKRYIPDEIKSLEKDVYKRQGYVYIAVPGMRHDCHDNLPKELLLSWTPEQLEYMHDID